MTRAVYAILGGDFEHGGSASRAVKEQLKKVGADPAVVRRAMIAAYEAEMNVVIHAHRGELRASLHNGQLEIEVTDEGPGIPDLEQALRPGFSTASARARELGFGAGMGLPNIKKSSDAFTIESTVGRGTRVAFSIQLRPKALYGSGGHSIQVTPEHCHACYRCVHACPTGAIRVFRGQPQILDYLCIDCTACIASCESGAITMQGADAELKPVVGATLAVTAPALVQFGAGIRAQRVVDELHALRLDAVRVPTGWYAALRSAVCDYARETSIRPVISPACPAVVNLIETRFPSLIPNVAPLLSPLEALRVGDGGARWACVVSCPCQRTALLSGAGGAAVEVFAPHALQALLSARLRAHAEDPPPETRGAPSAAVPPPAGTLRITGARHVVNILEQIENGLATDVEVVEPLICDEAGFGSPLMCEDPFLARHRWEAAPLPDDATARAVPRAKPLEPRAGLRLDSDMQRAIQKLGRIDKLTRSLPGHNCGLCGAPTCAALAEDVVLGRVAPDACVRQAEAKSAGGAPGTMESQI